MSRYLEILSVSAPAELRPDTNERVMWTVNFRARAAAPVGDWIKEVRKILSDAGLVTIGSDVFRGTRAVIPSGDGPYVTLMDSGGTAPEETHNGTKIERLSCQVLVRAADYDAGYARAQAIWRELDGQREATVTA